MKKIKRTKNKKGFISIEALAPLTALLAFMILGMGLYFYVVPKTMLSDEVQVLANTAKIQGGLTNEKSEPNGFDDITTFKKKMKEMGYDESKVVVTALGQPGNVQALGVSPISTATTAPPSAIPHIKRESKLKIEITVEVPSKKTVLGTAFYLLGMKDKLSDKYVVKKTVMSERY